MTSRRQEKFNSLLKHLIADFVAKNIRGALVTVAAVETSDDLKSAKISVSIFPENKEKEASEILKSKISELRHYIGSQIKTKFLPRLEFEINKEREAQKKIDKLLGGAVAK